MATVHFRIVSERGTQNNQGLEVITECLPQHRCRIFGVDFLACRVFRFDFSAYRVLV